MSLPSIYCATVYIPTSLQLLQSCWGEADGDSLYRRWRRPRHVPDALTQSLSVAALELDTEELPLLSAQSAISDAMENADALADIADCGFVELTSAGVSVAMVTSPAAAAVVCIF